MNIPLNDADLPTNPSPATRRRWVRTGVRGRKLRAFRCGNTYFTTQAWINEFLEPERMMSSGDDKKLVALEQQTMEELLR